LSSQRHGEEIKRINRRATPAADSLEICHPLLSLGAA
jgi:hypothetical protein